MKKIYSFVCAAAAVLTVASCQKEMTNGLTVSEGDHYTFSATIGDQTKTVLQNGIMVMWSEGDNITVFDADNKPVTFIGQQTEAVATADFSAESYNPAEKAYAVYPECTDAAEFDGNVISGLYISNTQTAVAGGFDPRYTIAVGTETAKGQLTFKNIHSLVKFTITGEAPEKVTFRNGGKKPIAGGVSYNVSEQKAQMNGISLLNINLVPAAGETFESGKTYYIAFCADGDMENMTLEFDGVVVKTVEGVKTEVRNGKIFDLGEVGVPEAIEFTENPAWTVEYTGAGTIYGETYPHTITVTSTDNNSYFITAVDKETFDKYDIETIAENEIAYIKEYIEYYNSQTGSNYTIKDLLFTESGVEAFNLKEGEWVALAIGVGNDDELSGLYAKSSVFEIEKEELDAAYADWIGDWIFTGANGVAWPITFSQGVANETFIMSGWENAGLDVEIEWDAENEIWGALIQNLGTYNFQGGMKGDIWFVAFDAEGYFYAAEGIPAFIGGYDEEGNRLAIGYTPKDNSGNTIEFIQAGFVAEISSTWYMITETEQFPSYPITITPAPKTRSVQNEYKSIAKFSMLQPSREFIPFSTDFKLR